MTLTKTDLEQIRDIVREEVGDKFETTGRQIVREEIDSKFETVGRQIVREEVESKFETTGRQVVREEIHSILDVKLAPIEEKLGSIEGRLIAVDNDIKDIYKMIAELQRLTRRVAHFEKYNLEQKILASYKEIASIATEAGVKLPQA